MKQTPPAYARLTQLEGQRPARAPEGTDAAPEQDADSIELAAFNRGPRHDPTSERVRWSLDTFHPTDGGHGRLHPGAHHRPARHRGEERGRDDPGAPRPFGAVLGDLMMLLGGDLEKLRARYDLSVDKADGGLVLGARPLADEVKRHVKSLSLRLPADLGSVQRIEIEESGGDRSVIAFPRMVRDVKVDPARMVPPRSR